MTDSKDKPKDRDVQAARELAGDEELEKLAKESDCYTLESQRGFHAGFRAGSTRLLESLLVEPDGLHEAVAAYTEKHGLRMNEWEAISWYRKWLRNRLKGE